ncbi:hypothetical protein DXG01_001495 [Tephrocybe rancida]|nr:hypothetical protein DXG01_001495 [Tephrocybe rancida]
MCAAQDADALLTTIDRDEHKLRLVSWAKAFSVEKLKHYRTSAQVQDKLWIVRMRPDVFRYLQARTIQLVEILKKKEREPVALSHWILLWAIDVMGDMAFSGGYETLMAGKDVEGWTEVLHKGVLFVGVLGQVPWMKDLVALAPVPAPNLAIQKSTEKKIEETRRKTGGNRNDILSIIVSNSLGFVVAHAYTRPGLQQNDTEGGIELTRLQLLADASLVMAAGSDTVSEAMTALMRYIAADAKIQWRLRVELTQAFDGPVEDMDAAMLLKLPYLDACVQEVLRLVPPVAAGPVRWNRDVDTQVLDKVIPAGTTVSSPNYAMFRDHRWLGGGSPHNGDAYVPFCFGAGTCIGKPVALHNMKFVLRHSAMIVQIFTRHRSRLLTACLIRAFDISIPGDFDVGKFDESYKEHSLWVHDKLFVNLSPL